MNAPPGLKGRALRGLRWNYLGTVGRIVATFASQIALARLLGPEQLGLFGYAVLAVSFAIQIVGMGLQSALVQVVDLSDDIVAIAYGRLLLVGAVASLAVYIFAEAITVHVFSAPQATIVLQAMAPTLLVAAGTNFATAILSREVEFKVVQLAALGSYVLGYLVVGIAAAWFGLGVWSLVLAWHVQTVTAYLAMNFYMPRSLTPGNPFRSLSISKFGFVVMFGNLVNWAVDSAPNVAIGRSLGPAVLGQFTIANNLVKVPADHLVRSLQTVLFTLTSRSQTNDAGVRRAYLTVLAGVGVIAFPTFAFVGVMSEPIVLLLLGPKWIITAQVVAPLAVAMMAYAGESLCGPVLGGRGVPQVELRVKAVTLVLSLAVLAVTISWSLAAVAWGVALLYLFRWVWMTAAVMRELSLSVRAVAQAMFGSLVLAAASAGVATCVGIALKALAPAASTHVLLLLAAGAVVLAATLLVVWAPQAVLGSHLLALLDPLMKQRPAVARLPGLRRIAAFAAQAAP